LKHTTINQYAFAEERPRHTQHVIYPAGLGYVSHGMSSCLVSHSYETIRGPTLITRQTTNAPAERIAHFRCTKNAAICDKCDIWR